MNTNQSLSKSDRHRDCPSVEQPDLELLELYVRARDCSALEAIVRRYTPLVYSVVARLLPIPQDREDACQATFLILVQSAARIRHRGNLSSWLYSVAFRTALRARQRGRRLSCTSTTSLDPPDTDSLSDPFAIIAQEIEFEQLNRELLQLPDSIRLPMIDHYFLGLTAPQIAERMEVNLATVEGRLRRGKKTLRVNLAKKGVGLSVAMLATSHMHAWGGTQVPESIVSSCVESLSLKYTGWSSWFSTKHLARNVSTHKPFAARCINTNSNVVSLVQGELAMSSALVTKFGSSIAIAAGVLAALTVTVQSIAPTDGRSPSLAIATTFGGTPQNVVADETDAYRLDDDPFSPFSLARQADAENTSDDPSADPFADPPKDSSSKPSAKSGGTTPKSSSNRQSSGDRPSNDPSDSVDPFGGGDGESLLPPSNRSQSMTDEGPSTPEGLHWKARGKSESARIAKIRSRLRQQTDVAFNEMPLSQVATFFSDQFNVAIVIDVRALKETGLTGHEQITMNMPEVPFEEALSLILEPLQLDYKVHPGYIEITTAKKGASIHTYDISELLESDTEDSRRMIADIVASFMTDMASNDNNKLLTSGSRLIVNCREGVHKKIEYLLYELSDRKASTTKLSPVGPSKNLSMSARHPDSADDARSVWEQLGLRLVPVPSSAVSGTGHEYTGGLKVTEVRSGSPFDGQGIITGDIIVGVMDWQTPKLRSIAWVLSNRGFELVQSAKFYLIRNRQPLTLTISLDTSPSNDNDPIQSNSVPPKSPTSPNGDQPDKGNAVPLRMPPARTRS